MGIRERKNRSRFLSNREPVQKIDFKQWIRFFIIIGAIVAVILAAVNLVLQGNIESSYLAQAETVRIGIRTDVQGFGQVTDTGEIQGFDADVAKEALKRILGEDKPIKFVPLTSEDAGAGIKYDKIDLGLGFLTPGTDRVKGFTLTDPYYHDNLYVAVSDPNAIRSLADLEGKNIGILNSVITQAQASDYLEKLKINAQVARYFGFEDATADMDSHKIDAFLAPESLLRQYMSQYTKVGESVDRIGYAIIMPSKQNVVQGVLNAAIHAMERDGTMENIANKWGIPYGSGR